MNVGKKKYTIAIKTPLGADLIEEFGDDMDEAFRRLRVMEKDKAYKGCRLQIVEEKVIEERVVI